MVPCMLQSGSVEAHVRVREVAIHITNHTVRAGDHGLVVVGASAEQGDLSGVIKCCSNEAYQGCSHWLQSLTVAASSWSQQKHGNLSGAKAANRCS